MGILIINSLSFFFPFETLFDPSLPAGQSPLDWMAAVFGEVFVDQKFMGLFSLLFGAGFLLFLERIQDRTASPLDSSLGGSFCCSASASFTVWLGTVISSPPMPSARPFCW